jgi:hypothetical protein
MRSWEIEYENNVAVVRAFMSGARDLVAMFADEASARRIETGLASVADPAFELIDRDSLESAGRPIPLVGFVAAWRKFLEGWERLVIEATEIIGNDDRVVVISRVHGRSKGIGIAIEDRRAAVWTFRYGRVRRIEQYAQPEEALAAAGLCEEPEPEVALAA